MRHHYTHEGSGAHFGAGTNCFGKVVAQLGDTAGEQTRVAMTPEEARAFAHRLLEVADKAELQPSLAEVCENLQIGEQAA